MNLKLIAILVVTLAVTGFAQQPNSPAATQALLGLAGPPFPIENVPVPSGVPVPFTLTGLPNAPFVTYAANSLRPASIGGFIVAGNMRIDLDAQSITPMWDGVNTSAYRLDGSGNFVVVVTPDPNVVSIGQGAALQTMLADPTNPVGYTLTAAHGFDISPGVTIIPGPTGDDTCSTVSLAPFNFTVPFYGQTYSSLNVCSNGFIAFNTTTTDFTSTPGEFLSQMPRIAGMWCDLAPNTGGSISIEIDESLVFQQVRVKFVAVPEFGTGPSHTFDMNIDAAGSIDIINSAFNAQPPTFTALQGITPGGNIASNSGLPIGTHDLSSFLTVPITTSMNDAVFEWFGTSNAQFWTPASPNPFDLTGRTLSYTVVSPGVFFVAAQ